MNKNFMSIIWIAGKFGIVIREHIETLIYTNKYSNISANRSLAKLVSEGYLKVVDRGKRKTNGYKLTPKGIKLYKVEFGREPKNYKSGDKLQHSIQIVNFYSHIIRDIKDKYNIEEINLMENKKLLFSSEKQIKYYIKDKDKTIIPDAFSIYKYNSNKAKVFYLEIENSERKASNIARKTLDNYENYFLSAKWKSEKWQRKDRKIFPYILIVAYSEYKAEELVREFKKKIKIEQLSKNYLFTDYKTLKEQGISGEIWKNIKGQKISLF